MHIALTYFIDSCSAIDDKTSGLYMYYTVFQKKPSLQTLAV